VVAIVCSLGAAPCMAAQETPPAATATVPASRPHIAYLDKSKIVYITAFDASPNSIPGGSQRNGTNGEISHEPPRLIKLMADDLLREFKKLGYRVKFLGFESSRPDDGILVMGAFTQVGRDGLSRRAVFSPEPPEGAMQVVVTTVNLYRSSKPLYLNQDKSNVSDPTGEPIVFNPEVAILRFTLSENPSDKAIKKTAEQIAAELERLTLQAESQGLAGAEDPINKYSKP
jgi:hypothetical protein